MQCVRQEHHNTANELDPARACECVSVTDGNLDRGNGLRGSGWPKGTHVVF